MKTSKFFQFSFLVSALLLTFLITSCDSTELVEPTNTNLAIDQELQDVNFDQAKLRNNVDKSTRVGNANLEKLWSNDRKIEEFSIYQLIDFEVKEVEQEIIAVQVSNDSKGDMHPGIFTDKNDSEMLTISGYGKGWSDEFGMSFIRIELHVYPKTMQVSGTLWCDFREIESFLEFELSGAGPLQTIYEFDGPHSGLLLESIMTKGGGAFKKMHISATSYFLSASELQNPGIERFNSYLMTIGEMYRL